MSEWKEVNSTNGETIMNSLCLSKFVGKEKIGFGKYLELSF